MTVSSTKMLVLPSQGKILTYLKTHLELGEGDLAVAKIVADVFKNHKINFGWDVDATLENILFYPINATYRIYKACLGSKDRSASEDCLKKIWSDCFREYYPDANYNDLLKSENWQTNSYHMMGALMQELFIEMAEREPKTIKFSKIYVENLGINFMMALIQYADENSSEKKEKIKDLEFPSLF